MYLFIWQVYMDKLRHYLYGHLNVLFFSIFIPLFVIASVIFMIKLASLTAIVQLSITEMGQLYLFILPELLFYTLPIAFVVASALALYRLSNDNEMVVIFSLGVSPKYLIQTLLFPATLLSLLLLINFLIITPYINHINQTFLSKKKTEAKFNLSASEFGQKFGNWMLFISSVDPKKQLFGEVVLFNKEIKNEALITAKTAEIINAKENLQLRLSNGEGYTFDDQSLKRMDFSVAKINNNVDYASLTYNSAVYYWYSNEKKEKKEQLLTTNTLLSLFPLLSLFLIVATGVVHARHQKRWIYLWLFVSIVAFYSVAFLGHQWFAHNAIWIVALTWLMITYGFYYRLVGRRF
jgi:lipopolysaccharide export system permease protein